jgi:hydroxymethylpyrimidine pyrophosphatase-like HAD family hydrolase
MEMEEKKAVEKAAGKDVVKTEPSPLMKTEIPETKPIKEMARTEAPKTEPVKEMAKTEAPKAEVESEAKTEVKTEAKKEAEASKEFVDGIMTELTLKGASKKRLIKKLVERYGMDRQRIMFKLKRALITERYAAAHEAAGGH